MKLKIVSPSQADAEAWRDAFVIADEAFDVTTVVQALQRVNVLVNGSHPDLLVVQTTSTEDFEALERLAATHPELQYVLVAHELTPEILMRAMRAGVREALQMPVAPEAVVDAVQRLARKRALPVAAARAKRHGKVMSFVSCKGGSGATFVAANLAQMLAGRHGTRVALIDLNLQFGDAAMFVSSAALASNVADVARNIQRLDGDLLKSAMTQIFPGLWVLPAPEDPARASDVQPQHVEAIVQLARTLFDFIVLDTGRALSAVTLKALDLSDCIYPVLQLTLPFIRDARRLNDVFRSLDYPASKIRWIANRHHKGGEITLDDLKKALSVNEVIVLPNQYEVVASSVNQGVPVDKLAPTSAISRALRELAREISPQQTEAANKRWLSGLFRGAPQQKGSDA